MVETTTFGDLQLSVVFVPLPATTPNPPKDYVPNPQPFTHSTSVPVAKSMATTAVLNVTTQPHLPVKGTAHALALLKLESKTDASAAGTTNVVYVISISSVSDSAEDAQAQSTAQVTQALPSHVGLKGLRTQHESWWSSFYPAGVGVN